MPVPPPDSATPGELMRRLDDNTAELKRLSAQLREDRDRYDMRYVSRPEWVEARRSDQQQIEAVARDVAEIQTAEQVKEAEQRGSRRQMTVGLIVCAAGTFGSLVVAIVMLLLSGGKT